MYHALGVLQARLLEETHNGAFGLQNARRNRLTVEHTRGRGHAVSPHRALDVPRHRSLGVRGGIPSQLLRRIVDQPGPAHQKERGRPHLGWVVGATIPQPDWRSSSAHPLRMPLLGAHHFATHLCPFPCPPLKTPL